MSSKSMSLKARLKDYALKNNITAQVVLQNYMFERFLERLSKSSYCQKFVIKGGMLIAAIVGLDTRSTMDLDTTLSNLPLTEEKVRQALNDVCSVILNDDVTFEILSISSIRKDDRYGGFCVRLNAVYDTIITPLSIDISTGDVITPRAVEYKFSGILDDAVRIKLWGYNIETVLAEKAETILVRGTFNTRPRDFYDIYILVATQPYDKKAFSEAFHATASHRGSLDNLSDTGAIITRISGNDSLKQLWAKYQRNFDYAKEILFEDTISALKELMSLYNA